MATNAGRSWFSDPRAKLTQAPAEGNPSRVKPVFICDSPGPCELAFAVIEWTKHISSTSSARWGRSDETCLPVLPYGLNEYGDLAKFPFSP